MRKAGIHFIVAALLMAGCSGGSPDQPATAAEEIAETPPGQVLRLDPGAFASVAQVWDVIGTADNPVWPGWNASDTPILIYFPGEQEILLNHPAPPDDYIRADGMLPLTREPMDKVWVRNGKTHFEYDGQNTRAEISGVPTLVVADQYSNMRSWLRNLINTPGSPAERSDQLTLKALSGDPYATMGLIAHEAFHVFQYKNAPDKIVSEALLLEYPTLSVENNLGVVLEAHALAAALRADNEAETLAAAREALAIRQWRREAIPASAALYEDGVEFSEGLAKYVEYALTLALKGRAPIDEMKWVRGFAGFQDMSEPRNKLIKNLLDTTDGTVVVNNDPFGAAPVRFRLYSSGMALAAVLDKLGAPDWRERMLEPGTNLTDLLSETLGAFDSEAVLTASLETEYASEQRRRVEALATDGEAANKELLASIMKGDPETESWRLEIDYSALGDAEARFAYTSFGVTALSPDRVIYKMIPIQGEISGGGSFKQLQPTPLLHDKKARTITFRVYGGLPELDAAVALDDLALPGVDIEFSHGEATAKDDVVAIRLTPAPADAENGD